ncbi:MAG: PspA/IM30 family protein [Longimicrobiales bacterium]
MFDNLRRAFHEAVDNFKDELGRDDVPEAVDRLLRGMKDETADAQADVRRLESEIETTLRKVEKEAKSASTCRRRERLAREIADEETATVAAEYAVKHEARHKILEQKAAVLSEELNGRRAEVQDMLAAIKQAVKNRDTLAASAGRHQARSSLGAADDLFDQLDRMESAIEHDDARRKAERDVGDLGHGTSPVDDSEFDDLESLDPEAEAEARLEELKRKLGKD